MAIHFPLKVLERKCFTKGIKKLGGKSGMKFFGSLSTLITTCSFVLSGTSAESIFALGVAAGN